ncbi:hypothetical protein GBAR_LOCUS19061 [Geodia barretti]|uniref:Uncharacterized protein n=1 Tax=Geodia barretti TaxID=519541 RepID=A0AA35WYZ2_GEOBA|nr:hypothetical protein GBAR_LOCUS19061 [Geodia barretti]
MSVRPRNDTIYPTGDEGSGVTTDSSSAVLLFLSFKVSFSHLGPSQSRIINITEDLIARWIPMQAYDLTTKTKDL